MPPISLNRARYLLATALLLITVIFAGCSKSGGNALQVKWPAGEKEFAVKSSYAFPVTKSFTDVNQKITTAVTYNTYAANYDLDAANFAMAAL